MKHVILAAMQDCSGLRLKKKNLKLNLHIKKAFLAALIASITDTPLCNLFTQVIK